MKSPARAAAQQPESTRPDGGPKTQREGTCKVEGCGCQGFSAAPGSNSHCIGRNSAGGTCNHSKDEHN